ncbi:membrane protein [Streptococcus pyogenes]|nr:membrane protein [Streptococcus pyogenes]
MSLLLMLLIVKLRVFLEKYSGSGWVDYLNLLFYCCALHRERNHKIEMLLIWLGLLFVWNELVFVIYAFDKRKAIKKKRRISERKLLVITVLFGGFGALLAAKKYHHKTRKWYFVITWYTSILLTLLVTYIFMK